MRERKRKRGVAERAGPGLGQGHEIGDRAHLQRIVGDQRQRVEEQVADRREVIVGIERKALEQELVVDDRFARQDADGVAVRRSLRAGARPDIERAAGPVLDHDRLTQRLLQFVRERAGEDVSPAAGAERNDDPDGSRRIVLGGRARTWREPDGDGGDDRSHDSALHAVLPVFIFAKDTSSALPREAGCAARADTDAAGLALRLARLQPRTPAAATRQAQSWRCRRAKRVIFGASWSRIVLNSASSAASASSHAAALSRRGAPPATVRSAGPVGVGVFPSSMAMLLSAFAPRSGPILSNVGVPRIRRRSRVRWPPASSGMVKARLTTRWRSNLRAAARAWTPALGMLG